MRVKLPIIKSAAAGKQVRSPTIVQRTAFEARRAADRALPSAGAVHQQEAKEGTASETRSDSRASNGNDRLDLLPSTRHAEFDGRIRRAELLGHHPGNILDQPQAARHTPGCHTGIAGSVEHAAETPRVQRTKAGDKIAYTFDAPDRSIQPVFSNSNKIFGATKFDYDVTFDVDEQGTKGTTNYRIGEFRQYYKGGLRVFGKKHGDWKNAWFEDTLSGEDHYGYRNSNTHASKYVVNADDGDKLEMWDKPEVEPVFKPDEIAYDQEFKGDVVAVDGPGGTVKEVLESKEWHLKGVGTRDKNDNIYYGVYYSQLMQPRTKSASKSKRKRKEAAGSYDKPTPDG